MTWWPLGCTCFNTLATTQLLEGCFQVSWGLDMELCQNHGTWTVQVSTRVIQYISDKSSTSKWPADHWLIKHQAALQQSKFQHGSSSTEQQLRQPEWQVTINMSKIPHTHTHTHIVILSTQHTGDGVSQTTPSFRSHWSDKEPCPHPATTQEQHVQEDIPQYNFDLSPAYSLPKTLCFYI